MSEIPEEYKQAVSAGLNSYSMEAHKEAIEKRFQMIWLMLLNSMN